jgi:S-adenosylmethionine:tRNA ribosyltransferase-isomerase
MDVREFDFDLPPELIAQEPAAERTGARLLLLSRHSGALAHHRIADLPALLCPGDLVVVNDTRVFPARLIGRRVPSGGAVECLLVAPVSEQVSEQVSDTVSEQVSDTVSDTVTSELWEALVHPGQKLKPGAVMVFEGSATRLHGEVLARRFFGRRLVRLWTDDGSAVRTVVDAIGHVPLPPYIKRADRAADADRYQTIFAEHRGSVAAPTAGLHFTRPLVDALRGRGVETAAITLHVGYGTFQPVRSDRVEAHRMEQEAYSVSLAAAGAINRALDQQRRVIAVGTTTMRTLETLGCASNGRVEAGQGLTDLFIYPGFDFRIAAGLLTNFHLPRSSLLMLVCAFAGRERVLDAYRTAIHGGYRFYSYGDAMLIL